MKTIQSLFLLFTLVLVAVIVEAAPIPQPNMVTMELSLPTEEVQPVAWSDAELECLTMMVYAEAGGESYAGKVAVAATAVTRSLKAAWPNDICKVVKQSGQFITTSKLRKQNAAEMAAWEASSRAADHATIGYHTLPKSYQKAEFFHAGKERLFNKRLVVLGSVGNHTFYERAA